MDLFLFFYKGEKGNNYKLPPNLNILPPYLVLLAAARSHSGSVWLTG